MSEWKSVPYGFGWAKDSDPSTYTAENMREDMEDTITVLRSRVDSLEKETIKLFNEKEVLRHQASNAQRAAYERAIEICDEYGGGNAMRIKAMLRREMQKGGGSERI